MIPPKACVLNALPIVIIYEDKEPTIPPSHALVPHSLLTDLGGSVIVPGDRTSYGRP